jgi:ribose transport system ATP-binding protein
MDPYKVRLLNIHKSFGGITALRGVTLKARPGEIHAIVGENGAGKSTLMKILAGACQLDSGEIFIDRERVVIPDPVAGRESGVGIIYQEFSLVPDLSVAENVYLHYLNTNKVWMPWSGIHAKASALTGSLGFKIPTTRKVRDLSTSQQQIVEIAKALSENAEILILDEPTAVPCCIFPTGWKRYLKLQIPSPS